MIIPKKTLSLPEKNRLKETNILSFTIVVLTCMTYTDIVVPTYMKNEFFTDLLKDDRRIQVQILLIFICISDICSHTQYILHIDL